jgi:type IV secretion system protein VirD4
VVLVVAGGEALYFMNSADRFEDHPLGAILIAAFAIFVILGSIFFDNPTPKPPEVDEEPLSNNFGSASFQSPAGRMDAEDAEKVWNGIFFGMSSSPMGMSDAGVPVWSRRENHTLIIAKTRTGKGTRVISPTLLRYGLGRKGASCIVIDPKGENAAITARARRQSQHVHIMNPWGELASTYSALGFQPATFNPLDVLDRHDPNAVAIAQALAAAMCPQERGGKDGFWTESAASLMTAVLLWLAYAPEETKTLARAREIVSLSRRELREKFLIQMIAATEQAHEEGREPPFGGAMSENASPFLDMAPETYSGVTSNLARFTKFLSDPQIKAATATSSFSMEALTGSGQDRPTTLYLVIPPDRVETQRTWLRLMITAGMQTFKRKPPGSKYRCLFLIDEFPALGKIEGIEENIATMAGYGVDFALIIQNFAQLKKIYGEGYNDIVSNCAYKWFCNINDLSTADYLSKTLGKKTIRIKNKGENEGTSVGDKSHSRSEGKSVSYSETGRELLTPDEVQNLGTNAAILLTPGAYPHYLRPIDYWNLQAAFETFRAVAPTMYWPLYFDPNPYIDPEKQAKPEAPRTAPPPQAPAGQPVRSNYNPAAYSPTATPSAPLTPKPATPTPGQSRPINLSTYAPKGPEDTPQDPPKKSNYNPNTYAPKDPPED